MNISILAVQAIQRPSASPISNWFLLLPLLCYGFIVVLVIIVLIRLARFLGRTGKEIKLTRMEVGKLAEEVQLLRRELKGSKEGSSSAATE